jgi:8-oxo-dGTP pyrophosphatase MutT (NUDIX family)
VDELSADNPGADDYARRLTDDARERRWPNVRPSDAATLIILDRSGPAPRVLMGRRHPGHKFMPGKFVFPGGRIEDGDRRMNVTGSLSEACEARLMARVQRPSMGRARALALAAIRETFEETGLAFGSKEFGAPDNPPPGPWTEFAAHGVYPDLEAVTFIEWDDREGGRFIPHPSTWLNRDGWLDGLDLEAASTPGEQRP